jgi:hypothetical protein
MHSVQIVHMTRKIFLSPSFVGIRDTHTHTHATHTRALKKNKGYITRLTMERKTEQKANVEMVKDIETFLDQYERGGVASEYAVSRTAASDPLLTEPSNVTSETKDVQDIVLTQRLQLMAHISVLENVTLVDTHRIYARVLLLACDIKSALHGWKQTQLVPAIVDALNRCPKGRSSYDILYVLLASLALARVDASSIYVTLLAHLSRGSVKARLLCDDGVLPTLELTTSPTHSECVATKTCACYCVCDNCWHVVCLHHVAKRLAECRVGTETRWLRRRIHPLHHPDQKEAAILRQVLQRSHCISSSAAH